MLELASLMARQARYRPDATAVVFENERLTYRQFWVRVARVGNMLRALGVGPGDKVATVAGNSASLLETYWAVPTIGATLVPLSPLLLATGLASLLHDSDARCLVTQASMLPVLREMRAELPRIRRGPCGRRVGGVVGMGRPLGMTVAGMPSVCSASSFSPAYFTTMPARRWA